jgi:hypothetical protein
MSGIDAVTAAIFQDYAAQIVVTDHSGAHQREGDLQAGQTDEDVIGSPAGALGLGANIGQLIALGVNINDFNLVNDPVSCRQQAGTRRGKGLFFGCSLGFHWRGSVTAEMGNQSPNGTISDTYGLLFESVEGTAMVGYPKNYFEIKRNHVKYFI